MLRCNYPNCRLDAMWTPVVEVPTMRTVGVVKPELPARINDQQFLTLAGFARNILIRNYEDAMADFKARVNQMVQTDKPTYLVGRAICGKHKARYNLAHWFNENDWGRLREMAKLYGFELQPIQIMPVAFKPVGWTPSMEYMEVA